ncbi:MAG: alpha-amylase family glycosyl hydrolase [Lysobacteraceae bacterium]
MSFDLPAHALRRLTAALLLSLSACGDSSPPTASTSAPAENPPTTAAAQTASGSDGIFGTREPFSSEAIYFVVTDRFVNGDPNNDQREQGGEHRTFDIPLTGPNGAIDNIGYLGGDFKGVLDNADYIHDMGFTSVWITPIVDNPDAAFAGGDEIHWGSSLTDRGKAGYHGYWGVNFWRVDEHLPSADLDFAQFTAAMREKGLKTVLDIVGNHGTPAFGPVDQPEFGKLYDADGNLLADHQNLPHAQLDPAHNPLHRWYLPNVELAQLSNFDDSNPALLDYMVGAYSQWIDQGAAAFRIDTIKYMSHEFWRAFAERIRAKHPGFYMFGEAFDYDAAAIAPFTWKENGSISVLDFPMKQAMDAVFAKGEGFETLQKALFLQDSPYANPYDLTTFYDNHDMARMDASDAGFIDAHHWLFTARGIPVVYYGSEMGFMRGTGEHAGNRNYFGREGIAQALQHPIHAALARIAKLRRDTPALQRGLQFTLQMQGRQAAFYRVLQDGESQQTALVALNTSDTAEPVTINQFVEPGVWTDAFSGETLNVGASLELDVPAHGVRVLLKHGPLQNTALLDALRAQQTKQSLKR